MLHRVQNGAWATLAVVVLAACVTEVPGTPQVTQDGLELRVIRGVDTVHVRPGVDFARYDRLMFDPVVVAFDPDWDPKHTTPRGALTAAEREQIRRDAAALFERAFRNELELNGGYQLVTAPGPDVLRVSASLIDLYINVPEGAHSGGARVYSMNAGRVTLLAELRDSESGAVIARVSDREFGRDVEDVRWSSSVLDAVEAERIFSAWARLLRERLDAVHQGG
jgi:hypothetical protein